MHGIVKVSAENNNNNNNRQDNVNQIEDEIFSLDGLLLERCFNDETGIERGAYFFLMLTFGMMMTEQHDVISI